MPSSFTDRELSPSDFSLRILGGSVAISPPMSVAELKEAIETEDGVLEGGGRLIDVEEPVTDTDGGLLMELEEAEKGMEEELLVEVKELEFESESGLLKEDTERDWFRGEGLLTDTEEILLSDT